MRIAKVVVVTIVLLCLHGTISLASDGVTIDAILPIGYDDFSYGIMSSEPGFGMGVSYDTSGLFYKEHGYQKIVLRADINYLYWHDEKDDVKWSYTRVPLFLGVRFYMIPHRPIFYAEGGLAIIYEKTWSEYTGPLYGIYNSGFTASHNNVIIAIVPGIGFEFPIGTHIVAGINARMPLITDSFGVLGFSLGYRF